MKTVFKIDGVSYDVMVPDGGLQRTASVLDGDNAGRSKSGRMIRDVIGTYYNYSLQIDTSNLNMAQYDTLYEVLTAPADSHSIVVPYGQGTLTFEAYISNVSDSVKLMTDGKTLWGDLSVTFTAMGPKRTP